MPTSVRLVQFFKKRLFPIPSLFSSHRFSPFGRLDLGAASSYSSGSSVHYIFSNVRYSYLHFLFRFFYELFCYPFSPPSFGADLCHLNSWRSPSLLMHCYVFFLAGCFQAYFLGVFVGELSLHFSILFMTLTLVLGCFPLDLGPYRSKSVYFLSLYSYSWVLTPLSHLVPYTSIHSLETRYLYSFRRKPAISKFDWHFTPMHKSSQIIATITGSFLLHLLRVLSNCSCIDHLVSGPIWMDFFVFTSPSLAHLISLANPLYKRYVIHFMTALVSMIFGSFSP